MITSSHILMKFMPDEYVDAFLKGDLYFNTLDYYQTEPQRRAEERYLKAHPGETRVPFSALKDMEQWGDSLEGTIGTGNDKHISADLGEYLLTDVVYRAIGYRYCNVLCFYKLRHELIPTAISDHFALHYIEPQMDGFGNSVVIIDDEAEFLKRIGKTVRDHKDNGETIRFLCGDVRYFKPMKDGKESDIGERNHLMLKTDQLIDIEEEPYKSTLTSRRDCFCKYINHSHECEWRIALYRGIKDVNAYKELHIGDIRDIAHVVNKDKLVTHIDGLVGSGGIKSARETDGFYGNVSRAEMKQLFYALGDNKAEEFAFFG